MDKHTSDQVPVQPWMERFRSIPVIGAEIYAVNPEIPASFLYGEVMCILDAVAEIADAGIENPITSAQAWMMEVNLRMAIAVVSRLQVLDKSEIRSMSEAA